MLVQSLRASSSRLPVIAMRRATTSSRTYASSSPKDSKRHPLLTPVLVGFTTGLSLMIFQRWRMVDDKDTVHCDGAPAVERSELNGVTFEPTEGLADYDDARNPMRLRMTSWIKHLQNEIVTSLEALEASSSPSPLSNTTIKPHQLIFKRDHWIRPEGGEGSSCILSNGRVLEKGGVNISIVHGLLPPAAIKQMRADHADMPEPTESLPFFAAGISLVLHPWNPHAPTVHLNYRYFEIDDPTSTADDPKPPLTSWFGGGTDLTPSYLYPEDATHFHTTLQKACNQHHPAYFSTFKKWCDKYFYIPHRKETRGVGGIFFDDLSPSSKIHRDTQPDQEKIFSFVKTISSAFIPAYVPILAKHKDAAFTDEERRWQLLRRGRYVEFNLVYDRGTKFGLMTPGARIESILMSLPETARWEYMSDMGAQGSGTREESLLEVLRTPKEWAK